MIFLFNYIIDQLEFLTLCYTWHSKVVVNSMFLHSYWFILFYSYLQSRGGGVMYIVYAHRRDKENVLLLEWTHLIKGGCLIHETYLSRFAKAYARTRTTRGPKVQLYSVSKHSPPHPCASHTKLRVTHLHLGRTLGYVSAPTNSPWRPCRWMGVSAKSYCELKRPKPSPPQTGAFDTQLRATPSSYPSPWASSQTGAWQHAPSSRNLAGMFFQIWINNDILASYVGLKITLHVAV